MCRITVLSVCPLLPFEALYFVTDVNEICHARGQPIVIFADFVQYVAVANRKFNIYAL